MNILPLLLAPALAAAAPPPDRSPDLTGLRRACVNEISLFCPEMEGRPLMSCLVSHWESAMRPCQDGLAALPSQARRRPRRRAAPAQVSAHPASMPSDDIHAASGPSPSPAQAALEPNSSSTQRPDSATATSPKTPGPGRATGLWDYKDILASIVFPVSLNADFFRNKGDAEKQVVDTIMDRSNWIEALRRLDERTGLVEPIALRIELVDVNYWNHEVAAQAQVSASGNVISFWMNKLAAGARNGGWGP